MKLDVKAMAITISLLWGACILVFGIANLLWPGYGSAILDMAASVYPGFHPANGFGAVIVGTLYGVVDGAIAGTVFAWLYNKAVRTS